MHTGRGQKVSIGVVDPELATLNPVPAADFDNTPPQDAWFETVFVLTGNLAGLTADARA
jgi:hypothetical protein